MPELALGLLDAPADDLAHVVELRHLLVQLDARLDHEGEQLAHVRLHAHHPEAHAYPPVGCGGRERKLMYFIQRKRSSQVTKLVLR